MKEVRKNFADHTVSLPTPNQLLTMLIATQAMCETVSRSRRAIEEILQRKTERLLVVVGPCSIHDTKAAYEYGLKLNSLRQALANELEIVMRVYCDKPRSSLGWRGLLHEPLQNENKQHKKVKYRLYEARKLLCDLNAIGLPTATEFLDVITPHYLVDLISWNAVGARTVESQIHRDLASALPCAVGLKNRTDGDITIAINAIQAAQSARHIISINAKGKPAIISTIGNKWLHLVLRGGNKPNYDAKSLAFAKNMLQKAGLLPQMMIDFSHGNSQYQHKAQLSVGETICQHLEQGEQSIIGVMIESFLQEGKQSLTNKPLVYGQSITDNCLGWEDTVILLNKLADAVGKRMQYRESLLQ